MKRIGITVFFAVLPQVCIHGQVHMNRIIDKLSRNEVVSGTCCISLSPQSANPKEEICSSGDPTSRSLSPQARAGLPREFCAFIGGDPWREATEEEYPNYLFEYNPVQPQSL